MSLTAQQADQVDMQENRHGRTIADEEIERLAAKSARGDVLDPIALNDPLGQSVEKTILRIGITVVAILISGILLAQVACKNMRLAAVPDLAAGANSETVATALSKGVVWSGDIMRFAGVDLVDVDSQTGVIEVMETVSSRHSSEQLLTQAMSNSMALAMNAFRDPQITTFVYSVKYETVEDEEASDEAFRLVWTRQSDSDEENPQFTCSVEGAALGTVFERVDASEVAADTEPGVRARVSS